MDLSDMYLAMCNTHEIQDRWTPHIGDYVVCPQGYRGVLINDKPQHVTYPDGNEGEAYVGVSPVDGHSWTSRHPIWLPTWSQLMDYFFRTIYPYTSHTPAEEVYLINDIIKSSTVQYINYDPTLSAWYWKQFTTHEQLLLAVIMLLKYKKYFDNENKKWTLLKWKGEE